jgi:hypothetical protein
VNLYKLIAFLCRYGHQPAAELWHTPIRDLYGLAAAVGGLMADEADAMREGAASGGG